MRALIIAAAALGVFATASWQALAHHGWSWTSGGNVIVEGVVRDAKLGLPHGVVTLDVDGAVWTVEVGQPWRNERAGLKESDFAAGKEIKVIGEPSADINDRRVKAERIVIGETEHVLYPGRD